MEYVYWSLIAWAVIAVIFFGFIVTEARKYQAELGPMHIVVAIIWPLWAIWYVVISITDWLRKKRA